MTVAVVLEVGRCGLNVMCLINLAFCFLFQSSQLACLFVTSIFGHVLVFRRHCRWLCWEPRNVKICHKFAVYSYLSSAWLVSAHSEGLK